jgi:hypothetical protein
MKIIALKAHDILLHSSRRLTLNHNQATLLVAHLDSDALPKTVSPQAMNLTHPKLPGMRRRTILLFWFLLPKHERNLFPQTLTAVLPLRNSPANNNLMPKPKSLLADKLFKQKSTKSYFVWRRLLPFSESE